MTDCTCHDSMFMKRDLVAEGKAQALVSSVHCQAGIKVGLLPVLELLPMMNVGWLVLSSVDMF